MDPDEAKDELIKYVEVKDMKLRSRARRGYLAAMKQGKCRQCDRQVKDYWHMGKKDQDRWEFDHIYPLEDFEVSPLSGMKQFRISGNDCARRAWETVLQHCMHDTILLCRNCHWEKTLDRVKLKYMGDGARLLQYYRKRGLDPPEEVSSALQLD